MTLAVKDCRRPAQKACLSVETLEGREVPGGWGGGWGGRGGRDWGSSWSHRSDWHGGDGHGRKDWGWSGGRGWRGSWGDFDWSRKTSSRGCERVTTPPRIECPKAPPPCPLPATSQVGGFVYFDENRDGAFQQGEELLGNVVVTLTGTAQNGTAVDVSTTTSATGTYNFGGLATGTYAIEVTSPIGLLPGHASTGDFGGTTGVNTVTDIAAVAGRSSSGYNFGLEVPRDQ